MEAGLAEVAACSRSAFWARFHDSIYPPEFTEPHSRRGRISVRAVTTRWHCLQSEGVCGPSFRDLPGGSVVRTPRLHGRGTGWTPGWGTTIPRAARSMQPKKDME